MMGAKVLSAWLPPLSSAAPEPEVLPATTLTGLSLARLTTPLVFSPIRRVLASFGPSCGVQRNSVMLPCRKIRESSIKNRATFWVFKRYRPTKIRKSVVLLYRKISKSLIKIEPLFGCLKDIDLLR